MVKKFTIPFASQGDANDIPDALQVDGKVSFTQGFGYDYERPYADPQAKDIAREDMNGLFKAITSAVGELQTLGASEWSSAISYPKGAIVYHEKDLYISQVDDNQNKPPQSWVSITSIANDSLKKSANLSDLTNKATARNNLGLGSSATLNKTDVLGTSTSLVATQKLVNDTKINLESSKQDKLSFVGGGKVMKEGAGGLLTEVMQFDLRDFSDTEIVELIKETGCVFARNNDMPSLSVVDQFSPFISLKGNSDGTSGALFSFSIVTGLMTALTYHPSYGIKTSTIYSDLNTTIDKNGFVRASGNKETFTKDLVSQSTGSSTTNVMSQKAVTDRLNSIESGHGLGYGQKWVDVTSQRVAGTTYTNNTGKPIVVNISVYATHGFYVDGLLITKFRGNNDTDTMSVIVPNNSSYRVGDGNSVEVWTELR